MELPLLTRTSLMSQPAISAMTTSASSVAWIRIDATSSFVKVASQVLAMGAKLYTLHCATYALHFPHILC